MTCGQGEEVLGGLDPEEVKTALCPARDSSFHFPG
jgi:hypothetical protein